MSALTKIEHICAFPTTEIPREELGEELGKELSGALQTTIDQIAALLRPLHLEILEDATALTRLRGRVTAYLDRLRVQCPDLDLRTLHDMSKQIKWLRNLSYMHAEGQSPWLSALQTGLPVSTSGLFSLFAAGGIQVPEGGDLDLLLSGIAQLADEGALTWMLQNGAIRSNREVYEPWKREILSTCNLRLIRCLGCTEEEIAQGLFPEQSRSVGEPVPLTLLKLLMCSRPKELDALLQHLHDPLAQELSDRRAQFLEAVAPYLARFRSPRNHKEIQVSYTRHSKPSFDEHILEQCTFALASCKQVHALYANKQYTKWSYEELLTHLTRWRAELAVQRYEKEAGRFGGPLRHQVGCLADTPMTTILSKRYPTRYARCYKEGSKIWKLAQLGKFGGEVDAMKEMPFSPYPRWYTHLYQGHSLTQVCSFGVPDGFGWIHTPLSNAHTKQLVEELNHLHEQILSAPVTTDEEKGSFYQLVSKAFWLSSQLMLPRRGNAHCQMMWLALIHYHHNLDPLVPSLDYPQPDCLALTWPLSLFQERFLQLFEPLG